MRRLWAYIIVVFTALVAVFASFPTVLKGISTSGEFNESRREFTFQLKEREPSDEDVTPKQITENSSREIAKIMQSRLDTYHVDSYDVTTSGDDIVTVSFSADSDTEYQQIITYLCFSGSFALINEQDNVCEGKDFLRGKAYAKDYAVNEYPTVIIPVKTDHPDYESVIDIAKRNPVPKNESSSEEEEGEGETTARVYLIFNYEKGETYQTLKDANLLNSKKLLTIDFTADDEEDGLYYNGNKNSFSRVCGFEDKNKNGQADPSEVRAAYDQADYLINLFSASALDYEVKCIRGLAEGTEVYLDVKVEKVLSNQKLVWNRTMTAVIAATIIVTLLLAYFYKLGAASAVASTIVSTFLAFLLMVLMGLEYNSLALVAIVLVAILSIVSSIIYLNKLKEDCYRGHTIKKANTEASKKSLLPIIDVHVVTILVGVLCYALGGLALRSFGAVLAIGSVAALLVNTLGLKGLMWLSTNATVVNGRYDLFAIDKEHVPQLMSEEKQTFYGTYTEKHFEKHKKSVSIISLAAFVLAIGGIVFSSVTRGGDLFKKGSVSKIGGEIYIQNRILVVSEDDVSPLNDISLDSILDSILIKSSKAEAIDPSDDTTYVTLDSYVSEKHFFEVSESKVESEVAKNYLDTYYKLDLKSSLSGNEISEVRGYHPLDPSETSTLNEILEDYFESTSTFTSSVSNSIELKAKVSTVNAASPRWEKILLATSIAIAAISVYLMLRYRLSRGLASIVFPTVASAVILGVMILINFITAVPANVVIAVPVITSIAYFFMIQFFNRERELIADEKVKDNSVEHRKELSLRALGIAYTPILASAVIGIYLLINFFGFGTSNMSMAYVAMFVGAIIALAIISVLIVPLCNILYKWFSKIKFERKPKENKRASKKPVKRSAEPEEAIFIGIND